MGVCFCVAPLAGFEPATYSLGENRSIRLSYKGSCVIVAVLFFVCKSRLRCVAVFCNYLQEECLGVLSFDALY